MRLLCRKCPQAGLLLRPRDPSAILCSHAAFQGSFSPPVFIKTPAPARHGNAWREFWVSWRWINCVLKCQQSHLIINTAAHFINVNRLRNKFWVLTLHDRRQTHFHLSPSCSMQVWPCWSSPSSLLYPSHRRMPLRVIRLAWRFYFAGTNHRKAEGPGNFRFAEKLWFYNNELLRNVSQISWKGTAEIN